MKIKTFEKILIANRGEIAVRIINSARKLGIASVAVYSEVDKDAYHVRMADEAYKIGDIELSDTYLNVDKIVGVAVATGCDAIHPGYGFLAESPLLVKACEEANITFIGPNVKSITLMGNKIEARKFVKEMGVPMTEGITGDTKTLIKNASKIDLPILVKAAAGGGGKGMRIVYNSDELEQVIETTSREALNYFGDSAVYIEKHIEEPRHIEFQVIGDNFGNVLHLFERECTIQRRYQKIIEESPSPTLTPEVRAKMAQSAVDIARGVGYNSVGTIEFLVDKNLNYYFLEMNTRIQVEHPVTEMVTGVDLVEEQIMVAAGNKITLKQTDIKQTGHAIECRIYAEDPTNNFMPSPGDISLLLFPEGENLRIDTSIDTKTTIHSFYDPMISKLIVWDETREGAIRKSVDALEETIVHGIKTNISYLINVLEHSAFIENSLSTKFCDEHSDDIIHRINAAKDDIDNTIPSIALTLFTMMQDTVKSSVWEKIGYWRNIMKIDTLVDEKNIGFELIKNNDSNYSFDFGKNITNVEVIVTFDDAVEFEIEGEPYICFISEAENGNFDISIRGSMFKVMRNDLLMSSDNEFESEESDEGSLFAPMPGKVIKVNVKVGDRVSRGKILLVVEAMKMENNIVATHDSVVEKVNVKVGDMVDTDVQLVVLEETENDE